MSQRLVMFFFHHKSVKRSLAKDYLTIPDKMVLQLLSRSVNKGLSILQKLSPIESNQLLINRNFHAITQGFCLKSRLPLHIETPKNNDLINIGNNLLQPSTTPLFEQRCGLKYRRLIKRRCRACYFWYEDGRAFIRCPVHPRHKQAQVAPKEKNTWILTSVSQKKKRPWA